MIDNLWKYECKAKLYYDYANTKISVLIEMQYLNIKSNKKIASGTKSTEAVYV